jgi:tetratricopeptide (TPR) repeat protein
VGTASIGGARVWDAETGEPLTPLLKHRIGASNIAFSRDGRWVVTTGWEGTSKLWDLAPDRRPLADLLLLANLLSGKRIDPMAGAVAVDAPALRRAWETLRPGYPGDFKATAAEDRAWKARTKEDLLRSVDQCIWAHQWEAEIRQLDVLLASEPGNGRLWFRRGEAERELGRWDAAVADYSKALQFTHDDPDIWQQRGLVYSEHLAQWQKAVADFSMDIRLDPSRAWSWNMRSHTLLSLHRWSQAIADASRAIQLAPGECSHWGRRADAYLLSRRWNQAIRDYSRAAELDPGIEWAPRLIVTACMESGQTQRAVDALTRALNSKAGAANYLQLAYQLALARLAQGDTAGYRKECAAMLARWGQAGDAETARWVAWTCSLAPGAPDTGRRALRLAEAATAKAPGNATLRQALGAALYRAGRWEEAAAALRASAAAPNASPAYAHFFLAMTRWQQGQQVAARTELKAALASSKREMDASPAPSWNRRVTLQLLRREAEGLIRR